MFWRTQRNTRWKHMIAFIETWKHMYRCCNLLLKVTGMYLPMSYSCSVNCSYLCWSVSSEILYSLESLGHKTTSHSHPSPSVLVTSTFIVSESVESPQGEKKPQVFPFLFLSRASLLSVGTCHLASHLGPVLCVAGGSSWSSDSQEMPTFQWCLFTVAPSRIFWETVLGHWVVFPLLWEETSKPSWWW